MNKHKLVLGAVIAVALSASVHAETFVEQSDYLRDQQEQNDHINAVQSAAQAANDSAGQLSSAIQATNAQMESDRAQRDAADAQLSRDIQATNTQADSDRQQQVDGDAALSKAITATNEQADKDRAVQDADRASSAAADAQLSSSITATNEQADRDRQQQVDGDKANAAAISNEARARAEANVQLSAGVSQAKLTGDNAQSRADQAFSNAAANARSISNTNSVVAAHSATLQNHEGRIAALEEQTRSNWSSLKGDIDRVERKANAGTSAALSVANIPQVTGDQRFAVGAGVGGYEGESALAVGMSSRVSQNVVVKASVTTDSQHGFGYGAGLSVGW